MLMTGTSFAQGKKCRDPPLSLKLLLTSSFLILYVYTLTTDPINRWVQYQAGGNQHVPRSAGWALLFFKSEASTRCA